MADPTWNQLLYAALGGGFVGSAIFKILDIAYQEFVHKRSETRTATEFVDRNLDPLLKAADELTGKLRSLADNDFGLVQRAAANERALVNCEFAGLVFLFGRFWAQIEVIRKEGMSVFMAKDQRGERLQRFLDCLELRRVRILDRMQQRAVGEVFLDAVGALSFVEFVKRFENEPDFRNWIMPLAKFLSRTENTTERQRLLQYGAVIHAMIDSLDGAHAVTRDRPSWPNKLTRRSWRDLNYRVFGVYLPFVAGREKYLGPPKKAAPKANG